MGCFVQFGREWKLKGENLVNYFRRGASQARLGAEVP